ncbi:MAG: prephenate dehydrogenase [Saprospiraceae bacterium]|nr:prephenate dehydrogenase [Saprospiraceae bacterium]
MKTVSIIGLGLIGGSFGLALRKNMPGVTRLGVDQNEKNAQKALELGIVDDIVDEAEAIRRADLIILATPVDSLATLLPKYLDGIQKHQTIIDAGSTKEAVLDAVKNHSNRSRYVATHPMAGTEYSGPEAALSNLFEGKCCVFCDIQNSDDAAVETARKMYRSMGMHFSELPGADHDLHVAYVSHISHIASFALALTVLAKEKEEEQIFELASGGFGSTVRLAKSNPETWIPIFRQNRDNVLDVLDEYINTVSRFRSLLIKQDFNTFFQLIEQANEIRRIIG